MPNQQIRLASLSVIANELRIKPTELIRWIYLDSKTSGIAIYCKVSNGKAVHSMLKRPALNVDSIGIPKPEVLEEKEVLYLTLSNESLCNLQASGSCSQSIFESGLTAHPNEEGCYAEIRPGTGRIYGYYSQEIFNKKLNGFFSINPNRLRDFTPSVEAISISLLGIDLFVPHEYYERAIQLNTTVDDLERLQRSYPFLRALNEGCFLFNSNGNKYNKEKAKEFLKSKGVPEHTADTMAHIFNKDHNPKFKRENKTPYEGYNATQKLSDTINKYPQLTRPVAIIFNLCKDLEIKSIILQKDLIEKLLIKYGFSERNSEEIFKKLTA